jgi:hypothetical protein
MGDIRRPATNRPASRNPRPARRLRGDIPSVLTEETPSDTRLTLPIHTALGNQRRRPRYRSSHAGGRVFTQVLDHLVAPRHFDWSALPSSVPKLGLAAGRDSIGRSAEQKPCLSFPEHPKYLELHRYVHRIIPLQPPIHPESPIIHRLSWQPVDITTSTSTTITTPHHLHNGVRTPCTAQCYSFRC